MVVRPRWRHVRVKRQTARHAQVQQQHALVELQQQVLAAPPHLDDAALLQLLRAARELAAVLGHQLLGAGFDPAAFHAGLKLRRAPIKQVLLAGDVVVGVGNIYASEALFLAGIRPTTRAHRLSRRRTDLLHAAIRDVLGRAVERGGSTLRDFSSATGETGHFQLEAAVYGRAGLPCLRCATPVRLIRQGQRSTFFCPQCQRG